MPASHSTAPSAFHGLWLPLVTPFLDQAQQPVDHAALRRLVRHYNACGVRGYVVCGSTGEAAALEDGEKLEVLRTVSEAAQGKPLIMGVSGENLRHVSAWVRQLNALPLHGLLVPPPSYIRPSQAGLQHWFEALADLSQAPLVVYDIPYRTGSQIALETYRRLYRHPNIQAVKDCGGDAAKTHALIDDGRLQVLAGEDAAILATLRAGGVGAIAAAAHVMTRQFADVVGTFQGAIPLSKQKLLVGTEIDQNDEMISKIQAAETAWEPLPAVIAAMFAEPNPASIKAALSGQGWLQNVVRAPMTVATLPAWKGTGADAPNRP